MIRLANDVFEGIRSSFDLFAENVDDVYKNVPDCGDKDVFWPADMEYQDRQAGIINPAGNYLQVSKRLVDEPYRD